MSYWTNIFGTIYVEPLGYSEHAREFVLRTVLDHLPQVAGSEGDLGVSVAADPRRRVWTSSDEFGQELTGSDGRSLRGESVGYFLTVHASLRDRMLAQTVSDFDAWLGTLAQRVRVKQIMVRVSDDMGGERDYLDAAPYADMFREPSYARDDFKAMRDVRRCPNWRYDFMPDLSDVGNWCETLPYLVPGGAETMLELDELGGCIPDDERDEREDATDDEEYEFAAFESEHGPGEPNPDED